MGIRDWPSLNPHLSDEQLALLRDGDLPQGKADHLDSCPDCAQRLNDIQRVLAAYAEYERLVNSSAPVPAPKPWLDLSTLVARQTATSRRRPRWLATLAASAGACVVLALFVVIYLGPRQSAEQSSRRASELLARSSRLALRTSSSISVRAGGRTFIRPAVLTSDASGASTTRDVQTAFETAHYSWQDPLSALSFRAWRSQLSSKRDSVSVVERDNRRSYRVQTETGVGILKSASLILRAADLQPTAGAFEFDGLGAVDLAEEAAAAFPASPANTPPARQRSTETPAGPEDTLRVLAALNSIGADVGEPIDVSEDIQHRNVVVRANGLSGDRAREVSHVLNNLPRVLLVLDSTSSAPPQPRPPATERYSTDTPESFRQQVEAQFGGALHLQEMTDRVLDETSSALAQAHAMQVLAQAFPPDIERNLTFEDRETLTRLHLSHVNALDQTASRIRAELAPLLKDSSVRGRDVPDTQPEGWQAGVPSLVNSVEATDKLLNRLLAGSYSLAAGEEMLRRLPFQIMQLESAIRLQRSTRK